MFFANNYLISRTQHGIQLITKQAYCTKARRTSLRLHFGRPAVQLTMRCGDSAEQRLQNQIKDVEELRQHIEEEWDSLDQRVIDSAITEWHKRLRLTENISKMHCERDCFASCINAARLLQDRRPTRFVLFQSTDVTL